ncbi:MAG: kynureninase [Flammeovirgaceae bacterium]|nr:kynureninase [Flammeovirgaceae bacterium]
MKFENSLSFARQLDKKDSLKKYRKQFLIPKHKGKPCIYFTGNSLGLQPIKAKKIILEELKDWEKLAVEGHLQSKRPWLYYHKFSKKALAKITGSFPEEVVAMNQLTVNLHLMMVSFYRPTAQRYKILIEAGAFSSDQYAVESQVKWHRYNPDSAIIEVKPRPGEFTLRQEDILEEIKSHGDELALILFSGVQYFTGQLFDFKSITEAGHKAGAYVGFDLAHAIGNVPLNLHEDQVDFAVWCGYKYLNSGPGAVAGAFVHKRHHQSSLPRFAGWWGHYEKERFQMKKGFVPMPGADGWQLSNFPVLNGAAQLTSLDLFMEAGTSVLRKKSELLTAYLFYLLKEADPSEHSYKIITPSDSAQRGCQLSIMVWRNGKKAFKKISEAGIVADWRESQNPNNPSGVIRVAPVPLYNTFEDVFRFSETLKNSL